MYLNEVNTLFFKGDQLPNVHENDAMNCLECEKQNFRMHSTLTNRLTSFPIDRTNGTYP